ncbi:MAG: hypothetical protein EU547_07885, partial [Promethearchaeota archaeon]
ENGQLISAEGVYIYDSSNFNYVFNNNISSNSRYGIRLTSGCINNSIYENQVFSNVNSGIALLSAELNFIENNIIFANGFEGIQIQNSNNISILENELFDNARSGILLMNSHNNTVQENIVYENNWYGIYLQGSFGTTEYNKIISNEIKRNAYDGIFLYTLNEGNVSHNLIFNNFIENQSTSYAGISIGVDSYFNILKENFLVENYIAIEIINGDNNTVSGNVINHTKYVGILLGNAIFNSIYNNKILITEGIGMTSGSSILISSNARENWIYDNLISDSDYGVHLISGDMNKFYGNTIFNCTKRGVLAQTGSDNNLFYRNIFLNNTMHAWDQAGTNFWNNSQIGNYWDNYTGSDSNYDGIGDTNWLFPGGIDYLPIWDDSAPLIAFISPTNNTRLGFVVPNFSVEIQDPNLDKMWYQFLGNPQNVFFSSNGSLDRNLWQSEWNSLSDGEYIYIRFYANDTFGQLSYKDLQVIKDAFPIISINNPLNNTRIGRDAPNFIVEVEEYLIDTMWYTIDGGLTNFTFTSNATIEQSAWQTLWHTLSDGNSITLIFYVNDSLGQLSYKIVDLIVDEFPIIQIITPINGFLVNNTAPSFSLQVEEYQIDSMWYTIDDGVTNFTFTNNVGTIDQIAWEALWNSLSDGEVITITFYVRDHLGQTKSESVQVQVNNPPPPPPGGGIPGFPLIIILGTLLILSSIVVSKRFKSIIN